MRSREFDIPEIGTRFENVDGIKEAFRFAINFGEDAGASRPHAVTIEQALERDFLAGEKLFCDSQNAAVATAAMRRTIPEVSIQEASSGMRKETRSLWRRTSVRMVVMRKGKAPPESQFSKGVACVLAAEWQDCRSH